MLSPWLLSHKTLIAFSPASTNHFPRRCLYLSKHLFLFSSAGVDLFTPSPPAQPMGRAGTSVPTNNIPIYRKHVVVIVFLYVKITINKTAIIWLSLAGIIINQNERHKGAQNNVPPFERYFLNRVKGDDQKVILCHSVTKARRK